MASLFDGIDQWERTLRRTVSELAAWKHEPEDYVLDRPFSQFLTLCQEFDEARRESIERWMRELPSRLSGPAHAGEGE